MKHEIIHTIFERGGENTAFAQYFVGQSYLNMLSTQGNFLGVIPEIFLLISPFL